MFFHPRALLPCSMCPAQIALNQPGMPRVIFHEENSNGLRVGHTRPLRGACTQ
jgi:tRNA(Arg) A34 adenosine deaminase TadA